MRNVLFVACLLLAGCSGLGQGGAGHYAKAETRVVEGTFCGPQAAQLAAEFGDERYDGCTHLTLTYPFFQKAAWLNKTLSQIAFDGKDPEADIKELSRNRDYQSDSTLKLLARYGHLLQFDLDVSDYGYGAAHPVGYTQIIVIDTKARAQISLDQILVSDGVKDALLAKQLDAGRQLLGENFPSDTSGIKLNENWKIVTGGLAFIYGEYEIGPYAAGRPEIVISKKDLQGIVRPEILGVIP